jgi:thioredoxin reductase (NADPH)
VIGGGDAAMEDTLALTKFAKEITVVHRRDSFRASKIMQERVLKNPKVKVLWNSVVKEIKGNDKVGSLVIERMGDEQHRDTEVKKTQRPLPSVVTTTSRSRLIQPFRESVTLAGRPNPSHHAETGNAPLGGEGKIQELPADGVFIAIGHRPNTGLFNDKIELDEKGFILTGVNSYDNVKTQNSNVKTETQNLNLSRDDIHNVLMSGFPTMTSVPGVFAAGDCVDFRYKQAITSAGMGCMAAIDAEKWLESSQ